MHAVDIGMELGSKTIIIPPSPGITCALGMLLANVRHDYVYTSMQGLATLDVPAANRAIGRMAAEASGQLRQEGFAQEAMELTAILGLRYTRQAYEIEVPIDGLELTAGSIAQAAASFHQMHHKVYGFSRQEEALELVNIRLHAVGVIPKVQYGTKEVGTQGKPEAAGSRSVFFGGRFEETMVYQRAGLASNTVIAGPAIIEQLDSTIVIHPQQQAVTDAYGNLIVHLQG